MLLDDTRSSFLTGRSELMLFGLDTRVCGAAAARFSLRFCLLRACWSWPPRPARDGCWLPCLGSATISVAAFRDVSWQSFWLSSYPVAVGET